MKERSEAHLVVSSMQLQLLNACMALVHCMRRKDARGTLALISAIDALLLREFDTCEALNQQVQLLIGAMEPEWDAVHLDMSVTDGGEVH